MITIKKQLNLPDTYPLERIGKREEILFFDIETTGFSGEYSHLYLIGCISYQENGWNLIQWFADSRDGERELLHAFFAFMKNYRILVHYNGDGFDLPYLLKRCAKLGLNYNFSSIKSLDIYKKIKPCKRLLNLNSLKQKAIEHFLGISRTDTYSGGELIEIYERYLQNHQAFLYDLLILHNEDDLKGMPAILPVLSYCDFLEHPFRLVSQELQQENNHYQLVLTCESDYEIPVPLNAAFSFIGIQAAQNRLVLVIQLFYGTLKHFYPDYKNYYYLIYEDSAIHKSVGQYVDRCARIKATAKNCYTKKEGCFLPQLEPIWEPVMKKEHNSPLSYVDVSDADFHDSAAFRRYLLQLLDYIAKPRNRVNEKSVYEPL